MDFLIWGKWLSLSRSAENASNCSHGSFMVCLAFRQSVGLGQKKPRRFCLERFSLRLHPDFITWGVHTDASIWILRDRAFSYQSDCPIPLRLHGTRAMTPWREIPSLLPSKTVEQDTVVPSFPPSFKYKLTYPPLHGDY